jgi:hypothetical protein
MAARARYGWLITSLVPVFLALAWAVPVQAQQRDMGDISAAPESGAGGAFPTVEEHVQQLESEVQELREQVREMKAAMAVRTASESSSYTEHSTVDVQEAAPARSAASGTLVTPEDRSILDYLKGTTINAMFDGYYDYNFNQPVGRVNLLRAYDVLSNIYGLNQADIIFERAPDVDAGRRFGLRLDLQFGEATATLQGNPTVEPRPDIFRNVFQAYGTYVIPVGSGLTVDFGKWSSSLGAEGNYTQYQTNYSRSYWFNYLPFYHMGVRAHYQVNKLVALNYWSVNGTNQTEPTNGFKDEMFGAVLTPNKNVNWTINYYFGQDNPNALPATGCGPVPRQPGLCLQQVNPSPNGKTHIFDSYVTWQTTPRLSFTLEGDYVIQRVWVNTRPGESSAPSDVWGGAAYAKYQLTPRTYVAGRTEYLNDHGGLFTGITSSIEALKEVTATYDFQVANGFDMRWEYRRDISNQPIFLTNLENIYSTHQDTATLGVIWWFGRKQGPW